MRYSSGQIKDILKNAPKGSQYYTDGYDVKYRKVIGDKYFGYLDEAKGWVETCDKQLSQERIDKGLWLTNLIKERENQMNIDNLAMQTPEEKEPELTKDDSPQGVISAISNRLHNIGCEHQDSELGEELGSMACDIWGVLPLISNESIQEKKPRTKVEYVKCEFSREWEAVKYYNEEGELFVIDCNGNYSNVNDISGAWYEVVCKNYDSIYLCIETTKPPQQREERERLEAAYDLYLIRCHAVNHPVVYEFHEFKSAPEAIDGWLAVVDKTSYRKESNQ